MTYELLKNKLTNGTRFLKKDAQRWIEALPLSVTPEQVAELQDLADANGLDFLPSDGEGRLSAVEATTADLTCVMADILGGAM